MNKEEAIKKIEELKKYVEECENDVTRVPDHIKWESDSMLFNDNKQMIYLDDRHDGIFEVMHAGYDKNKLDFVRKSQPRLKPIAIEDIEAGMWVLHHTKIYKFKYSKQDRDKYFLALKDGLKEFVHVVKDGSVALHKNVSWDDCDYFWQVVFDERICSK